MPNRKSKFTKDDEKIELRFGQLIKGRRAMLGLSQEELATAIGISHQQISKYEKGVSITAARLLRISAALGVPCAYFYEDKQVLGETSFEVLDGTENADFLASRLGQEWTNLGKKLGEGGVRYMLKVGKVTHAHELGHFVLTNEDEGDAE